MNYHLTSGSVPFQLHPQRALAALSRRRRKILMPGITIPLHEKHGRLEDSPQ